MTRGVSGRMGQKESLALELCLAPTQNCSGNKQPVPCPLIKVYFRLLLALKVKGNLSKDHNFCISSHFYGLSNFIQEAESQERRLNRLYLKVQRLSCTHPQNKSLFPTLVGMASLNTEEQMGRAHPHTVLNQALRTQGILGTEWKHVTGKAGPGRRQSLGGSITTNLCFLQESKGLLWILLTKGAESET